MSVEHVTKAIEAFLASTKPEVLCIRGRWGTGKTYNWRNQTRRLREKPGGIALNQYAYVSLFGINSIAEIKTTILQVNSPRKEIGDFVSNETLKNRLNDGEKSMRKVVAMLMPSVFGETLGKAIVSALSVMISEQIVCFDDLERKGSDLHIGDVLGYISHLKEDRRCKIVILLNEEAFQSEDDKQFRSYLEKVVDKSLSFEPTPAECAAIAIEDTGPTANYVRERVTRLGVDNVRVISKIYALVKDIEHLFAGFELSVFQNAASSIAVLGWSHLQPDIAPTWSYLVKRSEWSSINNKEEPTSEENAWNQLLKEYGYGATDQFDIALMMGIRAGYFEPKIVEEHAELLNSQALRNKAESELHEAWSYHHYSFSTTEKEVIDRLVTCFTKNVAHYRLAHLNSLANLLKQIGNEEDFKAITGAYLGAKKGNVRSFDLSEAFVREEVHRDLRTILDAELATYATSTTFEGALDDLYQSGFSSRLIGILANGTVDDFFKAFKAFQGDRLNNALAGLREILRLTNPTTEGVTVLNLAGEALERIGTESDFNKNRVRGWGFVERMEELRNLAAATAPANQA